MIRVLLESPFRGKDIKETQRNIRYARLCARDCFLRDEAPFASHLIYTQPGVLNDNVGYERQLGINAGLLWGQLAEKTVVYIDFGITKGMQHGMEEAEKANRPIEKRRLPFALMDLLHQTKFDNWAW